MHRVKVQNLWTSDGSQTVPLTSGTQYWFVPSTISATGFVANTDILTTYWYPIQVPSIADYMVLQFTGKLNAVTSITAVTADDVMIAACGMMYIPDNPALLEPHTVKATRTPPDFRSIGAPDWSPFPLYVSRISAAKVNDDINYYTGLPAFGTATGEGADPEKHTDHHRGCIFLLGHIGDAQTPLPATSRTPLTTDYPGWAVFINTRNTSTFGQGVGQHAYPRISGYSKVWIAVSHRPIFSSGPGSVQLVGSLDAIFFTDTPGSQ